VSSLDPIRSGTIFYAIVTGCILMASSLVGSWLENFVVFRRIPEALAKNRRLQRSLGVQRAQALSDYVLRNTSGIGVSLALGLLLGMTPVFGKLLGLPLDVRHVTLSTGQLALGVSALGVDSILTWATAYAAMGIVIIGFMNFGVSFALGLLIALRAREVSIPSAALLLRDTLLAFARNPAVFVLPLQSKPPEVLSSEAHRAAPV